MLTRIYIDNFRCFVNFEYKPAQKQLIMGVNGSGKSTLLDALLFLRRIVKFGHEFDRLEILNEKTLWMERTIQTFEVDLALEGAIQTYRLVVDSHGDPPRTRVISESVKYDGKPIFEFEEGKVRLFDDHFQHKVDYPFDWHRSALATITDIKDNRKLVRFKRWFDELLCFRINPFHVGARTEEERAYPFYDLANFAAWYRHLIQSERKEEFALTESLRTALDNFNFLKLEDVGKKLRSLAVEFKPPGGTTIDVPFDKLSDGQRCLICLYAILHFVLTKKNTVILDEPDNFISLREIQPWLHAVSDVVEESHSQILIISHHPELLDQWAPAYGVRFVRENMGPVRVKKFQAGPEGALAPSEIVARGWEREDG